MVASRVQSAALRAAGLRLPRLLRMRSRLRRFQRQQPKRWQTKSSIETWPVGIR